MFRIKWVECDSYWAKEVQYTSKQNKYMALRGLKTYYIKETYLNHSTVRDKLNVAAEKISEVYIRQIGFLFWHRTGRISIVVREHSKKRALSDPFVLCVYVCVCMVIKYSRATINRVRLPILLVVSWTGIMSISSSPFAPEYLVSQDGFGSSVPRQHSHLLTQDEAGAYLRDSSRFSLRRPFIYSNRHTPSGQRGSTIGEGGDTTISSPRRLLK